MTRTGTFTCSHPLINKLYQNIVSSTLGNFVSIPSDCPQRDERLGWTGDIQVFTPTASFIFDTFGLLAGWLKDVAAEQRTNDGVPPVVVPDVFAGKAAPHAVWADVVILTPWNLYQAFGDQAILRDFLPGMTDWLDRGLPRCKRTGLWDPSITQLGDWLDPAAPPQDPGHGRTDPLLVANAYLVGVTHIMSRITALLGHHDLSTRYAQDHAHLLTHFQTEYISPSGRMVSASQTAYALALAFNLLKPCQKELAVQRLGYLVRWQGFKISTGFVGTPIICQALADNGLPSIAYRMLEETGCPSWLYPVTMGATTMVSVIFCVSPVVASFTWI